VIPKLFHKIEKEEILANELYKVTITLMPLLIALKFLGINFSEEVKDLYNENNKALKTVIRC
jgi:hypothetical protein